MTIPHDEIWRRIFLQLQETQHRKYYIPSLNHVVRDLACFLRSSSCDGLALRFRTKVCITKPQTRRLISFATFSGDNKLSAL